MSRFVIPTSVRQPLDEAGPGFTPGPFGQWFTRHETWAEQAGPWIDYLARSSFLLQQGHRIADELWLYGEDSNTTAARCRPARSGVAAAGLDAVALAGRAGARRR